MFDFGMFVFTVGTTDLRNYFFPALKFLTALIFFITINFLHVPSIFSINVLNFTANS